MKQRKIKFKAWQPEEKRWLREVDLRDLDKGTTGAVHEWEDMEFGQRLEISQFTGLKDKNGKEIWEGDILRYHPYHNLDNEPETEAGQVVWGETGDSDGWSHGKHYEWTVDRDSLADVENENCEVIGNIYEQPELLKPLP